MAMTTLRVYILCIHSHDAFEDEPWYEGVYTSRQTAEAKGKSLLTDPYHVSYTIEETTLEPEDLLS